MKDCARYYIAELQRAPGRVCETTRGTAEVPVRVTGEVRARQR